MCFTLDHKEKITLIWSLIRFEHKFPNMLSMADITKNLSYLYLHFVYEPSGSLSQLPA